MSAFERDDGSCVRKPLSPLHLEHVRITSYGAFSNKVIGPFKPGLNVVRGSNESGKTTLASFVGGVLFGWEDARSARNTYKPENSERAGSLFFGNAAGEETELSRVRNADGLVGDASVTADIDKETFRTMFSLNSDALRSLRNTTEVTAKLLTAGSGTSSSPAHALASVQERLAEYTSRAAGVEHSLVNLEARQKEIRAQVQQAAEEAERFKKQDKEFHELVPQRKDLGDKLTELNERIENLTACRARLRKVEEDRDRLKKDLDRLREEEALLGGDDVSLAGEEVLLAKEASDVNEAGANGDANTRTSARAGDGTSDYASGRTNDYANARTNGSTNGSESGNPREKTSPTPCFSLAEDKMLRERIDAYAERQAKAEHRVEQAKESYDASKAAYEALLEARGRSGAQERQRRQRRVQMTLSVILPLMFLCAGVYVLAHGRRIASLSFMALGAGLVLFAFILAAAALVMLFRPNKAEEEQDERAQNAHWVMLQDQKKLEACRADKDSLQAHIASQLEKAGLASARGSLRRARAILDEMKEERANEALRQQRRQALSARRIAAQEGLANADSQRKQLLVQTGLGTEATLGAVDAELARRSEQRESLMEMFERMNRRYGELKQELSHAGKARDFDALKLQYQQIRTRQRESVLVLARLLLAKRMLEGAIAAWESKSQPEVYRQASRLLSLMTDGAWVKVAMTQEGKLQVTDAVKTVRDPLRLSLGTCQQLYLSLRIALLLAADNVGRSIPILADDILVNFDTRRRAGAARALAQLAQHRQVILFTCHEEVVEALQEAEPAVNVVEL